MSFSEVELCAFTPSAINGLVLSKIHQSPESKEKRKLSWVEET